MNDQVGYETVMLEDGIEVQKAYYHKQRLIKYKGNPLIEALPPILDDEEAFDRMTYEPPMDENIEELTDNERFHAISTLLQFFQPVARHLELQSRFSRFIRDGYISRNPNDSNSIRILNECYNRLINRQSFGIPKDSRSTSSSFVIMGYSGIGKTSGIQRVLDLYPRLILHGNPVNSIQIVWIKIDCPHDGSLKTLCLNFFIQIDSLIGTNYAQKFGRRGNTSTMVLQVALIARVHHVGALIVDEIQHILAKRGGAQDMLNFFVTLSNEIGIPIIMIGTMKARQIFQNDFRQARRAGGQGDMVWERMEYDEDWEILMESMWRYQWVHHQIPFTKEMSEVLYDVSQGILDIAIKLFMLAQARAINDGSEIITSDLIYQSLDEDLKMVKPMLKALQIGLRKELIKYEDITPMEIDIYLEKYKPKFDMKKRIQEKIKQQEIKEKQGLGVIEKVVSSLIELGFDKDRAINEVNKQFKKQPNNEPVELLKEVVKLLQKNNQKKPRKIIKDQEKNILLNIIQKGRKKKQSAYETLDQTGYIKNSRTEWKI